MRPGAVQAHWTARTAPPIAAGLKALRRDDDEHMDPTEFESLLKAYNNSFQNIAEGEVVKGRSSRSRPLK